MTVRARLAAAAALGFFATQSFAQSFTQYCPEADLCYTLNIPESTAKSGDGNIYIQISGPTEYAWIGMGQGSGMAGANIFVIYQDGNGNVTLSPRLGVGHVEPEHDNTAEVTLLAGSGVANGKMVANFVCSNCKSWQGGTMDFTGDSGEFLHASMKGEPINSPDPDAEIMEHQDHGLVTLNFATAKGGPEDTNPFVTAGDDVSPVPSSSKGKDVKSSDEDDDDDDEAPDVFVTAHGAVAALAFLVLFPSGAIFIRVPALSRLGGPWVHAAIQIFAYCTFIAAAGLGIYIASVQDQLTDHHPVIGMILLGVLFFQPFAGIMHHHLFKKEGRRTLWSYGHIFTGRAAIILGMINGGLGLQLAEETNMGYIAAYGVVAGVVGSAYLAVIVFGEIQRSKKLRKEAQDSEKEVD